MKKRYYQLSTFIRIIKKDIGGYYKTSFFKRIKMWSKGFLSEKQTLYQFDKNDYRLYLSDYHTSMARWINEPFNDILTNKLIFEEIVGGYFNVPETFGWIFNGNYFGKTYGTIEKLMKNEERFVMKAVTGGGGKNVYVVQHKEEKIILNQKQELSKAAFLEFVNSLNNFIICKYIEPGKFSKSLSNCLNTLRVLTLFDDKENKAFIARAVHRIGVANSFPMDNFTKGGLSANINLETGALSDATSHPNNENHIRYSVHPETNSQIEGAVIPNWDLIKSEIEEVASKLPMLKVVGWDIMLSDDGIYAIEGNHHPDPDVLQAHGPLLADERIRRFYKQHKIVK